MGLEETSERLLKQFTDKFPELRKRVWFGQKNLPRNCSTATLVIVGGGGRMDKIDGADSQDRTPRTVRSRWAAAIAVIFGKDYTEAEFYLHAFIALLHYDLHGKVEVGPSYFVNEGSQDLSQYGEHFRLPFWVKMKVDEWDPPALADVLEVEVENVGVNANPSIPPNPPQP